MQDGTINIATGRSRKETNWKNREYLWSALVQKLGATHRTAETYAEYLVAKKSRQDEIKDIGGFVGGYLTSGRRKVNTVRSRQLLTLDIDHGRPGFWEDFTMTYGEAACLYSTHKHSPESPRLRLIMPLDRECFADEYVAIGRRVAGNLGIDFFDHTTFEPSRLMYWPSTSIDGIYEAQAQDGPWLSADATLASYSDWRDSSEWPVSSRVSDLIQHSIKKQGDPLEKPGVIGAFCRTYSIAEAIEMYLGDVYDPCDIDGRYTYKEGSTTAGLVIYEDKFAYSHHGTDPTSGRLSNAFDLVRIHKYGLRDEDGSESISNAAMRELAAKDSSVVLQIGQERMAEARAEFETPAESNSSAGPAVASQELVNDDWMKNLSVDSKGNYTSSIDNIYLIIKNDLGLKDSLYFDEFEGRLIASRDLPWRKVTKQTRDFTDDDSDCLAHFLEGYKMPFAHIPKALAKIRTEYKTHPIRNYLNGLTWDGQERLSTLFIDFLGADDNEYVRSATRKTFVAAVARVFEPGIKFDTVLTLVGKEGIGKSTVISKLAQNWFSDCLGDIHAKEGMESLRGVWIMEIAELGAFRRAEKEAIKRFITSREDLYRPAYGKQQVKFPRQCIFFATTNEEDFLTGSHGNRRFLPISTLVQPATKNVFLDLSQAEIDQIWAEALRCYNDCESLDLEAEIKVLADQVREDHSEVDDRAGLIEKYLQTSLPETWEEMDLFARRSFLAGGEDDLIGTAQRRFVCVAEIWCEVLNGMHRDMTQNNTKHIHDILQKMKGWVPSPIRRFGQYGRQRAYEHVSTRKNRVDKFVNTDNTNVNTN